MILRATEKAIREVLQLAIDDAIGEGFLPILLSDEEENKPQMPYVVVQCVEAEEQITPGCGIFKVTGEIRFRSHTRASESEWRQEVLDAINNFAYDETAAKLSAIDNFHCHGWQPTTGTLAAENETKSYTYALSYSIFCMARDNA